jgi:hypothetical protein
MFGQTVSHSGMGTNWPRAAALDIRGGTRALSRVSEACAERPLHPQAGAIRARFSLGFTQRFYL